MKSDERKDRDTLKRERQEEKHDKARLKKLTQVDEAIDESFPASDPPSWMPVSNTKMEDKKPADKH